MFDFSAVSLAALVSIPGIGQRTASHILRQVEEKGLKWQEFWAGREKIWRDFNLSEMQENGLKSFTTEHTIESYFERLLKKEIRVINEHSAEYPPLLKEIDQPPVVLFVRGGEMQWQPERTPIAVVGTRHMTAYGKLVTEKITEELVWSEATIISGFMYGVDVCAHTTALENSGKTVGILGFGFDFMYPRSQQKLYQECLAKGMTYISPFSPDVQPILGNFPARNAVVAGMSAAVVVTEAAEKSGTHITAGFAVDFGRTVCAVPGPITSPYSQGTKWLVNQGAVLVQSGEEVLQEVMGGWQKRTFSKKNLVCNATTTQKRSATLQEKIVSLLQCSSLTEDEFSEELCIPISTLTSELTLLEIQGSIVKEAGKWFLKN